MKRAPLDVSRRDLPAQASHPAADALPAPHPLAARPGPAGAKPAGWMALPPVWFALTIASMLALHLVAPAFQWNLGAARWWGVPFAVAGILLVQAGVRRFTARTTLHPFRAPSELVTGGWFARSRNPMYTGLVLSLVGGAVMLGSLSSAACIPPFVLLLRWRFIAHEERALEARFGDAYRSYRRRVRRWL